MRWGEPCGGGRAAFGREGGGVTPVWDLSTLLGTARSDLDARLGPPEVDRRVGDDVWLRFSAGGVSLRVRCEPAPAGGAPAVASWTATFAPGRSSLRSAAETLGLWPAAAPDRDAAEAGPLIRRPLPDPSVDRVHSLTATVRAGRIVQVTAFDEPPDWL